MDKKDIVETAAYLAAYEFLAKYVATKALDGLGGKNITTVVEEIKHLAQERIQNTGKIIEAAFKKAQQQTKAFPAEISPRVVERLLNEGSYCSDAIMREYYAGVLLSNDGGYVDDEGIFYLSTIHRLSSIQLRAHYIIYQIIRDEYIKFGPTNKLISHVDPLLGGQPAPGLTFIPADLFLKTLFGEDPVDKFDFDTLDEKHAKYFQYTDHIVQGLRRENLVRCFFGYAGEFFNRDKHAYYFFAPTLEGIELFLWGQGYGKRSADDFLSSDIVCPPLEGIQIRKEYHHFSHGWGWLGVHPGQILEMYKQKFDR